MNKSMLKTIEWTLRVGESIWAFVERGPNRIAPLALCFLLVMKKELEQSVISKKLS